MTKIIKVSKENPEKELIQEAVELLKKGEVVSFPTETVYGLGAILKPEAIKKIFLVKNRPQDNPVIVHVSDKNMLLDLVKEIPENAENLMNVFWPGPLTLVFKKSEKVGKEITCGLDTIAIRMPENKIALALIEQVGALAAPSANLSGKPSPTKAEHVYHDLNNKIELIIDGGNTDIGLESTVFDLESCQILRPGKITKEQIEKVIGEINLNTDESEKPKSPGMKYKHYSPGCEVILCEKNSIQEKINEEKKKGKIVGLIAFSEYSCDDSFVVRDLESLGRGLFNFFRELEKTCDVIIVEKVEEIGLGAAIMNRLKKASGIC